MSRVALALSAVLVLAVPLGGCAAGGEEVSEGGPAELAAAVQTGRRPVLLVTIDTLRWDALGSYGGTATSALDALAAQGVRFEHAVAHAVMTLPSHTSILTGIDPSRHGVHDNTGYRAGDDLETLAERLAAAGYATGAFVGAFPVDSMFGLAQGFDVYDDAFGAGAGSGFHFVERRAEAVVRVARDWIAEQDGDWFAWVHVFDPHAPYDPPVEWENPADPYAGEVAYTDAALAPLLSAATAADALVVVTADHGEALGDHGESTHGVFAYASTLRVPLLIGGLGPEVAGRVVAARARHVDILPTVLAGVGLPADPLLQGRSLLGALADSGPGPDSYFEALTPNLERNWAPLRGLYRDDLKFVDLPLPELYDVAADPREDRNLAAERATDLRRMRDALDEHLAGAVGDVAPSVEEDPETLRRLRALGYTGGRASGGDTDYGPEDDPKNLIALDNLMQQAVGLGEAGQLDAAIRLVEQVLAERPDYSRAATVLASLRYRAGDLEAAVRGLEAAHADGAETPYLLGRLAFYYKEAGRLPEAAAAVESALRLNPEDVEHLDLLATIYGMGGRIAEAEATLERALELDPTWALLHANRGTLLLSTGRPAPAAAAFARALDLDPSVAEAHNGLGVIAAQFEGDPEAAIEHWQRAVNADPRHARAWFNLGATLARAGQITEAITALERYVALVPGDADGRDLLARLRRGG